MKSNRSITWAIAIVLLCLGLNLSGPSQVLGESDVPATLLTVDCQTLRRVGLDLVADYFYDDEPDRALSAIMLIEERCGSHEPLRRIQLLGSIWDGSFSEDIYGYKIIDDLVDRADLENADLAFAHFDSFTTSLADQLLPHVEGQSLEEFFCLFHSGQVDEAYSLLQGNALRDTDLYEYYHGELNYLERDNLYGFGGVYGSLWSPSGNLARLGEHVMAGATLGWQFGEYFARGNFGFRFARSKYPYYVDHKDVSGWSDRTVGVKMTFEVGAHLLRWDRHAVGAFVGGGLDVLHPFNDVDEFTFMGVLGLVGLEYKVWLGQSHLWSIVFDVEREWYSSWDGIGSDLTGDAWDFRLGVGITPKLAGSYERRGSLGRK